MFAPRHPGLHGVLTILLLGSCVTRVPAQAPDNELLQRKVAEQKVAAQKLEKDVADAIAESRRVAASNPARALETLKRALAQLEGDTLLTDERRAALTKQLKARIRLYGNDSERLPPNQPGVSRRADEEAQAAEDRAIQRTLQIVAQLKRQGKTVEAARIAHDLARRFPRNPAANAARAATTTNDNLASSNDLRNEANYRFNGAMVSVDRSKLPPIGDIEFPKDWNTRIKKRKGLNEPLLTPKEQAIVKALGTVIPVVNYDNARFEDVIQDVSTKMGQPIVIDRNALNDAQINSDTPISLKIRGVTSRTLLRKILGDYGLAYVVKGEVIQVLSAEKAKELMVTRTYYLGDLLAGGTFAQAGILFNQGLDQIQAMQNVVNIIGLIQSSVDPSSWQANGGQGTITFAGGQMGLIIRQSAEVHGMLGGMLK